MTEPDGVSGSESNASTRWWLVMNHQSAGPFDESHVASLLREGRVTGATLACPVGGQAWKSISESSQLRSFLPVGPPPILPGAQETDRSTPRGWFTNPRLPFMANCICVVCIVIYPVLWGVGFLFGLMTGGMGTDLPHGSPIFWYVFTYETICSLMDFGIIVTLLIGGLMLRKLRKSGPGIIKTGLVLSLGSDVLRLVFFCLWSAIISVSTAGQQVAQPELSDGAALAFLLLGIGMLGLVLASTVFDIVSLVWLLRHGRRLPLDEILS